MSSIQDMKKLVLAFGAMLAIAMFSCIGGNENNAKDDTPEESAEQVSVQVTGVAIDGAMNSVYLKVGDDTIEFTYPDLDSEFRDSWDINDTLTVQYYETANGDSVTSVINENA